MKLKPQKTWEVSWNVLERDHFLWNYVNFNDEKYYVFQNGIVTIPKSTEAERIEENCKVRFGYALKSDERSHYCF